MWANDDNVYNNNRNGGGKNVLSKEEWDAEDNNNGNINDDDDDEYKERDDVDVGFDDFVTNGSGKEVEDEINDVVGTIVTMNKKCIYTINVDSTRVQGETEGGSLAS